MFKEALQNFVGKEITKEPRIMQTPKLVQRPATPGGEQRTDKMLEKVAERKDESSSSLCSSK